MNNTNTRSGSGQVDVVTSPPDPTLDDATIRVRMFDTAEEFFFAQAETAIQAGIAYGSFFIMAAGLHFLASLYHGSTGNIERNELQSFCSRYLRNYNFSALYESLRCGLFHRGVPVSHTRTPGVSQVYVTENHDEMHDPNGQHGYVVLNAESFLADLRDALATLVQDAANDSQLMQKCRRTYETLRPITF